MPRTATAITLEDIPEYHDPVEVVGQEEEGDAESTRKAAASKKPVAGNLFWEFSMDRIFFESVITGRLSL